MRGPDRNGQRAQLHRRGFEISAFVIWFIREENIPPFNLVGESASGGISILGWSWGNTMSLSFVARARELPKEDQEFLEAYVRTLVIYGEPIRQGHSSHALMCFCSMSNSFRTCAALEPERYFLFRRDTQPHPRSNTDQGATGGGVSAVGLGILLAFARSARLPCLPLPRRSRGLIGKGACHQPSTAANPHHTAPERRRKCLRLS